MTCNERRDGNEIKNPGGLTLRPSSHTCQDIRHYVAHLWESGSPLHSYLLVSLPISVISFDIWYHLLSTAHQGGCFITLFSRCLKAAEWGGQATEVSLLHHSDRHNLNVMLHSYEITFLCANVGQEITCVFCATSASCLRDNSSATLSVVQFSVCILSGTQTYKHPPGCPKEPPPSERGKFHVSTEEKIVGLQS